jgi:SAM-dependent methyltransferase
MNDVQEIDVDELMAQIRANLPRQPHLPATGASTSFLHSPLAAELSALQNNREIRYFHLTSHRKFLGSFVLLAKKLARKLLTPSLERQTGYNTANMSLVQHFWEQIVGLQRLHHEVVGQINELRHELVGQINELRQTLTVQVAEVRQELHNEGSKVREDSATQVAAIRHELAVQVTEVRHELTQQRERSEELAEELGGVHQEQEAALQAIRGELATQSGGVHQEHAAALQRLQAQLVGEMTQVHHAHAVSFQEMRERFSRVERRLRRFIAASTDSQNADVPEAQPSLQHPKPILGRTPAPSFDYFGFEERFRGSEEDIKERQRVYVEFFKDVEPVLDIGCGRGEFLELAREAGIKASGVDLDLDMVLYCREKELDVTREDAFAYLESIPDASLGGIFAAQVVEHLEPTRIIELVNLCHRKLQLGGVLIFETPNPVCLTVFARSFYMDLSHTRPVHPEAMKFLLESAGFKDLQVRFSSPVEPSMRIPPIAGTAAGAQETEAFNQGIERLNELLYGFQDFAVIGKKSFRL